MRVDIARPPRLISNHSFYLRLDWYRHSPLDIKQRRYLIGLSAERTSESSFVEESLHIMDLACSTVVSITIGYPLILVTTTTTRIPSSPFFPIVSQKY